MDGRVNSYSGSLEPLGYDIIPLFSFDDTHRYSITDVDLKRISGEGTLSWNIISKQGGIS